MFRIGVFENDGLAVLIFTYDGDIAEPTGLVEVEDGTEQSGFSHVTVVQTVVVTLHFSILHNAFAGILQKVVGGTDAFEVLWPEIFCKRMFGCGISVCQYTVIVMYTPERECIIRHTVA